MSLFTQSAAWVSDEHRMFADMTNRFYADELTPNIERWVDQGIVDRSFWHTAGQAGIMGGAIPEEFGGAGGDMGFESITIYEQTRTGDCGWGYGIQSIVTHYITAYGTNEQKARWLPGWPRARSSARLP